MSPNPPPPRWVETILRSEHIAYVAQRVMQFSYAADGFGQVTLAWREAIELACAPLLCRRRLDGTSESAVAVTRRSALLILKARASEVPRGCGDGSVPGSSGGCIPRPARPDLRKCATAAEIDGARLDAKRVRSGFRTKYRLPRPDIDAILVLADEIEALASDSRVDDLQALLGDRHLAWISSRSAQQVDRPLSVAGRGEDVHRRKVVIARVGIGQTSVDYPGGFRQSGKVGLGRSASAKTVDRAREHARDGTDPLESMESSWELVTHQQRRSRANGIRRDRLESRCLRSLAAATRSTEHGGGHQSADRDSSNPADTH